MKSATLLLACFLCFATYGQPQLKMLAGSRKTSLRGMSVGADNSVWVSGSNGTVGRSTDGGKTWNWMTVSGWEEKDFRDIEAFDSNTAIAMGIDNPAVIIKTTDGGNTWRTVFEKLGTGLFLDAMDFKNPQQGICIGDPVSDAKGKKRFYLVETLDGGDTWAELPDRQCPPASDGEAIFAGSGSNIYYLDNTEYSYAFVTGGLVSNLYLAARKGRSFKTIAVPVVKGRESAGTFSVATDKRQVFYCVGGDYKKPAEKDSNFCTTTNAGTTWTPNVNQGSFGYRSCIKMIGDKKLVTCGPTGVDYSTDSGATWQHLSDEGFNTCALGPDSIVYFAGTDGKVAQIKFE